MNPRVCWAVALLGWLAVGCQSMKVRTTYDHEVAFREFRTYCWVPAPAWLRHDPRLHMDLVEPLVEQDVEAELLARGFRRVDCAAADLQVTFTAAIDESNREVPTAEGPGANIYETGPGGRPEWFTKTPGMEVVYQRVPSLAIQMRRPGSDRVAWQGTASGNLPPAADDTQRADRIRTAVRLIMREFPPPR